MAINDGDYNQARELLAAAGSLTAEKADLKDSRNSNAQDGYGKQLIIEAIMDFRDGASGDGLENGMSVENSLIVARAAGMMGLSMEYIYDDMADD